MYTNLGTYVHVKCGTCTVLGMYSLHCEMCPMYVCSGKGEGGTLWDQCGIALQV